MFYRRSVDALSCCRRPVVLIHGLGLSGRYMLPVAERLARHVPVYLPDLPGFGDSAKPDRALDVPALADALAGWIEAMALAPVALLGNSFGCQIIADLAARHPVLVERAVLEERTSDEPFRHHAGHSPASLMAGQARSLAGARPSGSRNFQASASAAPR
jgi:pimeloyl-ACP methyl ester carboxylesterase